MRKKRVLKLYRGGYWHDSSTWYEIPCIFAKNEKEAYAKAQKHTDGLGMCELHEVTTPFDYIPKEVVRFFMKTGFNFNPRLRG